MKYTGYAPAKINLAIDVHAKRPDGYHEVSLIMHTIPLFDLIAVKVINNSEIIINTDSNLVPNGESNIVYKTAQLIKDRFNVEDGVEIKIVKNIPVAAGLAGGSSDAATTIKLLNKTWNLRMSKTEIYDIAKKIGSDVSFCVEGGTALAEGLGERLTPLVSLPDCYILLVKPDINIKTKEIYEGLELDKVSIRPDIKGMIDAINRKDLIELSKMLCNVLESVTAKEYPIINTFKEKLIEYGALGSLMSGSGPTVFGIFNDEIKALSAYDKMKCYSNETFLVKNSNAGLNGKN